MPCSKLLPMLLALTTLSLASCGTATSNACPPVVPYTPQIESRAADDLDRLPPESPVRTMIADYGAMRAEARVCALAKS